MTDETNLRLKALLQLEKRLCLISQQVVLLMDTMGAAVSKEGVESLTIFSVKAGTRGLQQHDDQEDQEDKLRSRQQTAGEKKDDGCKTINCREERETKPGPWRCFVPCSTESIAGPRSLFPPSNIGAAWRLGRVLEVLGSDLHITR